MTGTGERIRVLVPLRMPQASRDLLQERYDVHYWPDPDTHPALLANPVLRGIRAVQTNGSYGLNRSFIEAMPRLEIICALGAGFEGIDVAAAKERGIVVTHGPGTNAETVADQAWALLLGVVRRVPWCDRGVREGRWATLRQTLPSLSGKRLGIFGLGHVGRAIARRGGAGFGMEVGYHGRTVRAGVDYAYFETLTALATWCDVLVVAAPGGPETRHAIDGGVLAALGPDGYLVNVARGSLVDSGALAAALRSGGIAGAGLDVIDGEPAVPDAFLDLERLVLSPHLGGYRRRKRCRRAIESGSRQPGRPFRRPTAADARSRPERALPGSLRRGSIAGITMSHRPGRIAAV